MKVKQFFDSNLKEFSVYDCTRSISSIFDGFKPTQRKLIHALLRRGETAESIKVSSLSAAIVDVCQYHHGDASGVIVGLAQDFTGANNLNYLEPDGQFGNRLSPHASAARYIFTKLTPHFRQIFKKEDDLILEYLEDEGVSIEPKNYIPILPNVLINGSEGMGTGYASKVFAYNPEDLKTRLIDYINNGNEIQPVVPWYQGFNGRIYREESGRVVFEGSLEIINTTTIKITELPIGTYLDGFKSLLSNLIESGFVKSYDEDHTSEKFDFTLTVPRSTTALGRDHLLWKFKLVSRDSENLTFWVENGKLKVFEKAEDVIKYFADWRLAKYEQRRLKQLEILKKNLAYDLEKKRFISFYIQNSELFSKKKKAEIQQLLLENQFNEEHIDSFLNVRIYNLVFDEIQKLDKEIDKVKKQIKELEKLSAKQIYLKELNELSFI